jgi:hypothetical protein
LDYLLFGSFLLLLVLIVDFLGHFLCGLIGWHEWLHLEFTGYLCNFSSFGWVPEVFGEGDGMHLAEQHCVGRNEGRMEGVFGLYALDGRRGTFGQSPERLAILGLGIKWVGVQQLQDIIPEQLVEDPCGSACSLFEISRSLR